MIFDTFTLAAVIVFVALIGVLVRVCTLRGDTCNAGNEIQEHQRKKTDNDVT